MTLYKGTTPIAGLSTNKIVAGRFLLEPIWSDHIINDIQYLRADTFSWQSGDVYTSVYNKLVEEYSTGTEETEGDITFKRSTNGFKIADASQESTILSKYNLAGIAWYYILDTTNQRFKLPRAKHPSLVSLSNTAPVVAYNNNDLQVRLSSCGSWYGNTLGTIGFRSISNPSNERTSTFYSVNNSYVTNSSCSGNISDIDTMVITDLSKSNKSIEYPMMLYFYVGEYSQTAIEQTAGLNAELFNGKLDNTTVHIVETYINGTSGYNIWSNGYCEQWGEYSKSTGAATNITISLVKKYQDTNYNILALAKSNGSVTINCYDLQMNPNTKVNNSFGIGMGSSSTYWFGFYWQTKGYLAVGQY